MNAPFRVPTSTLTRLIVDPLLSVRLAVADRADLDGARARQRNPGGDGERFVEILHVDEHVAAELLARLRERPIGHQSLAIADPHAGCRGRRKQRMAAEVLSARPQLLRELERVPVDALTLARVELLPARLIATDQQHVFHARLRSTPQSSITRSSSCAHPR